MEETITILLILSHSPQPLWKGHVSSGRHENVGTLEFGPRIQDIESFSPCGDSRHRPVSALKTIHSDMILKNTYTKIALIKIFQNI